jgi:hypothetical protein
MFRSEAENSVGALEEDRGMAGLLLPQLAGHVVVGTDDFRDCLSFPEGDGPLRRHARHGLPVPLWPKPRRAVGKCWAGSRTASDRAMPAEPGAASR